MAHYTLDLDPQQLRNVAKFLGEAEEHLRTKGTQAGGTAEEIGGQWTGQAATAIKAEMDALGGVMTGGQDSFSHRLGEAEQALTTLAGHFDTANEDLAALNTRWDTAQTEYDDAPIGDHDPDGGGETAGERRTRLQGATDTEFDTLKEWVRARVRECGEALAVSSPIGYRGYSGSTLGYTTSVDLLLPLLSLTEQRHDLLKQQEETRRQAREDAERLRELVDTDDFDTDSSEEIRRLLEEYGGNADDPIYAEAFLDELGPAAVKRIYDSANYFASTGETTPEDWEEGLLALNDLMANGLSRFDDNELGEFVGNFDAPEWAPIIGAITGSDHADDRIKALALALSYDMRYDLPNDDWDGVDLARRIQDLATGDLSYEDMVNGFADAADPELVARLLNEMSEDDRNAWIGALLDHHAADHRGARDADLNRRISELVPSILEAARDNEQPAALEGLLEHLQRYDHQLNADMYPIDISGFLKDPKTLDVLAKLRETMDQALVAEIFEDFVDEEDMNDLIRGLIIRDAEAGAGMEVTARNVGYLLGLAEAADFDYDMAAVLDTAVEQARGHLETLVETAAENTKWAARLPYIKDAIAILEAFSSQSAEAQERRENFGDSWSEEAVHENFAWLIYLQNNGAPPSYQDWLDDQGAQSSVPDADPLAPASLYLDWLEDHGPGTEEYDLAQELRNLQQQIEGARK
ncbi:hypothetical protein DJ010_02890 [Nocardioides silvaticus]|uniref:WXG100 family type VII secretion target n=1 Tax=Nocardioides silvaticus TaxID=2201891 RepID=A0A316TLS4_9ACTN|nr:WXG100 family type VII secretion target [Nocardioides silvaticus]PWN04591.1 hypothetical protein DJ010_02890 [Nocardioides silvaticus]